MNVNYNSDDLGIDGKNLQTIINEVKVNDTGLYQ
jgi:hypothetical protein